MRPQQLPSTYLRVHYALIILLSDPIKPEPLKEAKNKYNKLIIYAPFLLLLLLRHHPQILHLLLIFFYRMSEKSGTDGNFIYYLHYMLCMFTPTLYAFSQPLYHVRADFAQRTRINSSTTVCNSLPKVTKITDFNSIHLCLQESPKCKVSTLSSNINAILSLLTCI
jgi:hypothetical protein